MELLIIAFDRSLRRLLFGLTLYRVLIGDYYVGFSMGFINVNMTCGKFLPKNNYFASNQIAPYSSLFYTTSFLDTCVDMAETGTRLWTFIGIQVILGQSLVFPKMLKLQGVEVPFRFDFLLVLSLLTCIQLLSV